MKKTRDEARSDDNLAVSGELQRWAAAAVPASTTTTSSEAGSDNSLSVLDDELWSRAAAVPASTKGRSDEARSDNSTAVYLDDDELPSRAATTPFIRRTTRPFDLAEEFKQPEISDAHRANLIAMFGRKPFSLGSTPPLRFDREKIKLANDSVRRFGIKKAIASWTEQLRNSQQRSSAERVSDFFEGIDPEAKARLIQVHEEGRDRCMLEGWRPNGASTNARSGLSSHPNRDIFEHRLAELVRDGKAVAIDLSCMSELQKSLINVNEALLAFKSGNDAGRFCINFKKGVANEAFNDCLDRRALRLLYPKVQLTSATQVAELACRARQDNPGEALHGATMDVSGAYNLVGANVDYCLDTATRLGDVVIIFLTNQWADAAGGDAYGVISTAIDAKHNVERRRSVTYVDDTILVNTCQKLTTDMTDMDEIFRVALGPDGQNEEKRIRFENSLVALGAEFDLRPEVWRAAPKERNRWKLEYAMFVQIPEGSTYVAIDDLRSVAGLLLWHSNTLVVGKSFLYTIYDSIEHGASDASGRRLLSEGTKQDLEVWRTIVAITAKYPHYAGVSLDHLRVDFFPSLFCRTDASTTIGAGGILTVDGFRGRVVRTAQIMWTIEELRAFQAMGVAINTLEFLAAFFCLLVWTVELQDSPHSLHEASIAIELDNKAAISWLMKQRGRSKSAYTLVRAYSLAKFIFKWNDRPGFVRGVDNVEADHLSRAVYDAIAHDDEPNIPIQFDVFITQMELKRRQKHEDEESREKERISCNTSAIQASCRELLMRCVVQPDTLLLSSLLGALTSLAGTRGCNSATTSASSL